VRSAVTALLGPTNTGKTHLALERMLAHPTGMMGFPLRLLARENYDRIVAKRGASSVALITGEERIVPPRPSYFVCTVEAMPLDRAVDFLAVDEVQLAADRERGHVFTHRLLHARGIEETWLLGADTIRPLLRRLVPEAAHLSRPRLSTLSYSEPRKLRHLPRRSAVIAFSLAGVYELAERLRREAGGVAVVFGALSPRTRNAQVGLYQGGEVDYLVATDAIGMGLNLDIDHVAFTSLTKFDGVGPRELSAGEVAQIAGRAGRHLRDGSFGATAELPGFEKHLVRAVEEHRFEPLSSLYWRSEALSFASPAALLRSLEEPPPTPELVRMRRADDHEALRALVSDAEVMGLARRPEHVALLWEVCQVPDFRSVLHEGHTRLLAQVFAHLRGPKGQLPEDWVAAHVSALDRPEGDIDGLLLRIAGIRTWTYVSHRGGWLADAGHWQQRTRAVEDRLSDALHERLTEQFVDRRATVIARHEPEDLLATVDSSGEVLVQGLSAGRLEGFRFLPAPGLRENARGLLAAANRALRGDAAAHVARFLEEPDDAFCLRSSGAVDWRGAEVARLVAGDDVLSPRLDLGPTDILDPPQREKVRRRLAAWVESDLRRSLAPLYVAREADLPAAARGLAFTVTAGLGLVSRRSVAAQVAALAPAERQALGRVGVSIGRLLVWVSSLDRRSSIPLRALLWSLRHGAVPGRLPDGRASTPAAAAMAEGLYAACGYQVVGPRAVRADRLEHLAARAQGLARRGAFPASSELAGLIDCTPEELKPVLVSLGYRADSAGLFARPASRGKRSQERRRA
jgi:ATP-dependent RNA helicase SUPV3L1/SUV3